ncbi:hypothetical protein ACOTDS_27540, partial [Achromobacter xylosoxidans]
IRGRLIQVKAVVIGLEYCFLHVDLLLENEICTANARAMGTRQADTFRRHSHRFQTSTVTGASIGEGLAVHRNMMSATNIVWNNAGSTIDDSGGNETRPLNTAYHPRIHA